MPHFERLTSLDNPRIKQVVRLRLQRDRRRSGLFIAEGMRELSRAAAAGLVIQQIFVCPDQLGQSGEQVLAGLPAVPGARPELFEVARPLLMKMSILQNPEGILAIVAAPQWSLETLAAPPGSLWLVAQGMSKPGNLGAMVRSAAAAGAAGVLVADGVVDSLNPSAIRNSTAAVFALPVVGGSTGQVLTFLMQRGARIIAATPEASVSYSDAVLTGELALVIGAESQGLSDPWRQAGQTVSIPMASSLVDSLNAAAAAAVLLFEARRQRQG